MKTLYYVTGCGGSMNRSGVINLPGGEGYHNNMNCQWNISAPAGKAIMFKYVMHLALKFDFEICFLG